MTNQLLLGVNFFNQTFSDANNSFDTQALGLFLSPDAPSRGSPSLGAPNMPYGGLRANRPYAPRRPQRCHWDAGRHCFLQHRPGTRLPFGGEFRQGRVNKFYHRRGTGKFSFDGTQGPGRGAATGTDPNTAALADFLAGDVSSSTIAVGNAERFVRVNGYNFFGQDSICKSLTS